MKFKVGDEIKAITNHDKRMPIYLIMNVDARTYELMKKDTGVILRPSIGFIDSICEHAQGYFNVQKMKKLLGVE